MNITQVANQFGVAPSTLRYYERIGLIPPVNRTQSGIRDYKQDDINWIEFIKCMRDAGLSIEALIEYTTLFMEGDHTIEARKKILADEREKQIEKRKQIDKIIKRLEWKIEGYNGKLLGKETELMQK
ncbi:MerR family transcriptional regulator [Paenibacillus segetis]|uniref:HTH-type transcriptional regulator AdhR n=1 Tax=Paenibacillus segetis TaxID=1325360 RepID=A0ABQ1YDW4_9BACL|nr:MerR family transcriptional regulator [Paenibacillus segetis]GGH20898.1 HTH-type transcriptional regulator AdhR [Paenibacillus segetis]